MGKRGESRGNYPGVKDGAEADRDKGQQVLSRAGSYVSGLGPHAQRSAVVAAPAGQSSQSTLMLPALTTFDHTAMSRAIARANSSGVEWAGFRS